MNDAKYVIVNGGLFGDETAIVFDKMISHEFFKGRAVSAGFVRFGKTKDGKIEVCAYGKSDSLNVKSREEDSDLICKALNNSYFGEKLFIKCDDRENSAKLCCEYEPIQTIEKKCIHHNRSLDPVDVPMPGGGVYRTVGIYTTVARCPICSSYEKCTKSYKLTGDELKRHQKLIENYKRKNKGSK